MEQAVTSLAIWTVYDHPRDYPDKIVARRWDVDYDGAKPTSSIIVGPDLQTLRDILEFEMHLTCLARLPEDDPKIVETWL
jgi:hypothetical protein